jgi:hypothetical protein
MKDIITTISDWFKERFSSSIFANFIFIWIIYNWRFVYITLFLPGMVGGSINKLQFYDLDKLRDFSYIPPIIISIFITFCYPWVNSLVSVYRYKVKRKRMMWELEWVDKIEPIPPATYYSEKKQWIEKEKEFHEAITSANQMKVDISGKDNQISKFAEESNVQKIIISQKESEIESKVSIINSKSETIENLEKQIIEIKSEASFPNYLLDHTFYLFETATDSIPKMLEILNDDNLDLSKLKTIHFTPNKVQMAKVSWSIRTMKNNKNRIYILAERNDNFIVITMSIPNDQTIIDIKIIDIDEEGNHSGIFKIKGHPNKQ